MVDRYRVSPLDSLVIVARFIFVVLHLSRCGLLILIPVRIHGFNRGVS